MNFWTVFKSNLTGKKLQGDQKYNVIIKKLKLIQLITNIVTNYIFILLIGISENTVFYIIGTVRKLLVL